MIINLNNYVTFYIDNRNYNRVLSYFDNNKDLMNCYLTEVDKPLKGMFYLKMQVHMMIRFVEQTSNGVGYIHSMEMIYSEN